MEERHEPYLEERNDVQQPSLPALHNRTGPAGNVQEDGGDDTKDVSRGVAHEAEEGARKASENN